MNKGGYRIVDFKSTKLTTGGGAVVIDGVFNAVKNDYKKATLLSGVIIDGTEYPDEFGVFELDGSDYKIAIHGTTTITIKANDSVTVTE